MNKQVKGYIDISGIKRCYVDILLDFKCPECNSLISLDLSDNYLSHPIIGEVMDVGLYCHNCHYDFVIPLKIISAEIEFGYNPNNIKKI